MRRPLVTTVILLSLIAPAHAEDRAPSPSVGRPGFIPPSLREKREEPNPTWPSEDELIQRRRVLNEYLKPPPHVIMPQKK